MHPGVSLVRLRFRALVLLLAGGLAGALALPAVADEGMWTLDNLPVKSLRERYSFVPTPGWVDQVRKGCVNFGGGSGSFVSADGLVLTNHHVALGQLQKLSSAQHNYVHDGFFARTAQQEVPCPDLELKVLESMENVTPRVTGAVDARAAREVQAAQRRAAMASIEKESTQKTGLKSEVIELYHGGEYWLYRYHKYTDVRLVMAPEEQAAFFGGDPDNFGYPRHDLDFAFFRIYENGHPVHPDRWFRMSASGPAENDLVFVAGHPGSTSRFKTVAQLEVERDLDLPIRIALQEHRLSALREYCAAGPENDRRARDRIRGLENNLKRQRAFLELLKDPKLMDQKRDQEARLQHRVQASPQTAAAAGAWARIGEAEHEYRTHAREWLYRDLARGPRMVNFAEQLVRYAAEVQKPNERRLREYRESNLPSIRFQILSPAPVYRDVDEVILAAQLEDASRELGLTDPWVKAALEGRSPTAVAAGLCRGSALTEVGVRQRLLQGGAAAIEASKDPLIVWARRLDPIYRQLRTWHEDKVEGVESSAGGQIARARFALDGKSNYPDATGTLRLSYGKVAGYDQLTTQVPWKTTFYGLFDRSESFSNRSPFDLPGRVAAARPRLDLAAPLNFVCTDDIIGGNSGSPVLSRDLELVGLVFDGNVQSFRWDYGYEDDQARCVAVDSRAILEALQRIYGMDALARELTRR